MIDFVTQLLVGIALGYLMTLRAAPLFLVLFLIGAWKVAIT